MYKKKYLKYKDKYLELKNKQIGGVNPCKNQCGYNALPGMDYCCRTCRDSRGINHGLSLTQGTHPSRVGPSKGASAGSGTSGATCKNQCGYNALPGKDYCCMTCKDTGGANHGASLTHGTHPKKVGASTSAGARISSGSRISSISLTNPGQTLPRIMGGSSQIGGPEESGATAAGIIPYYIDASGQVHFLLGLNHYNGQVTTYQYFGGGRESCDVTIRDCAYREAKEESHNGANNEYGLPLRTVIHRKLTNGEFMCIPKQNGQNRQWNNFYFIHIDKTKWENGRPMLSIQNNEVNRLEWFRSNELPRLPHDLRPIERSAINYFMSNIPPTGAATGAVIGAKFCINCGAKFNTDKDKFCVKCGKKRENR